MTSLGKFLRWLNYWHRYVRVREAVRQGLLRAIATGNDDIMRNNYRYVQRFERITKRPW